MKLNHVGFFNMLFFYFCVLWAATNLSSYISHAFCVSHASCVSHAFCVGHASCTLIVRFTLTRFTARFWTMKRFAWSTFTPSSDSSFWTRKTSTVSWIRKRKQSYSISPVMRGPTQMALYRYHIALWNATNLCIPMHWLLWHLNLFKNMTTLAQSDWLLGCWYCNMKTDISKLFLMDYWCVLYCST